MRRVADHLSEVLDTVPELAPIDIQLLDAHRCVAAEDIIAPWSLPPFDAANVEGYAVRSVDLGQLPHDVESDTASRRDDGQAEGPGLEPDPRAGSESGARPDGGPGAGRSSDDDADDDADGADGDRDVDRGVEREVDRDVDRDTEPHAEQPSARRTLAVVGEVRPGDVGTAALGEGHAVRIRTGAQLPAGADAVVPLADSDGGHVRVTVTTDVHPGENVRLAAADVATGDIVMRAGTYLGATQVGLLAAVGRERVRVRPRPRVVLVSVGTALVEPGLPVSFGQVTDSNSYTLAAAVDEAGAVAYRVPPMAEDPKKLASALSDQLVRADLVITAGGIGARYDVMREVFASLGDVTFNEVPMSPGPIQGVGVLGEERIPVLALPGDPASAFVAFEVFARPAIRRMLGVGKVHRPSVRARLAGAIASRVGERTFALATVSVSAAGGHEVMPLADQQAHHVTNLVRANALAVVPEPDSDLVAGDEVDCLLLERRRG